MPERKGEGEREIRWKRDRKGRQNGLDRISSSDFMGVWQKNRSLVNVEAEYRKAKQVAERKELVVTELGEVCKLVQRALKRLKKQKRRSLKQNKTTVMFSFNRNLTQKDMTGARLLQGIFLLLLEPLQLWVYAHRLDMLMCTHARMQARTSTDKLLVF